MDCDFSQTPSENILKLNKGITEEEKCILNSFVPGYLW